MAVEVSVDYISGGINPISSCASWRGDWLAFGVHNSVALSRMSASLARIDVLLRGHELRVCAVAWVTDDVLLSASADHTARLWFLEAKGASLSVQRSVVLKGHSSSVTAAAGLPLEDQLLAATCAADSIRVWTHAAHEVSSQVIEVPHRGLCLSLKFCLLSARVPLLLCGVSSAKVVLYLRVPGQDSFAAAATVPGHEGWVRAIDCAALPGSAAVHVATGSNDRTVRLWRIEPVEEEEKKGGLQAKELRFPCGDELTFVVRLDAVLTGHEDNVTGVAWTPDADGDGEGLRLLTGSMDKSMILWKPDSSGLWAESLRVGEVGVGGLGLLGCCAAPDGRCLLAYGYKGGFSAWRRLPGDPAWRPALSLTGHFSAVADVAWEPARGSYLLSAGREDQTCRLHAPWATGAGAARVWHEVGRPQVHGYDLAALAPLAPDAYASGSEEKTVRLFQAPRAALQALSRGHGGLGAGAPGQDPEMAFLAPGGDLMRSCLRPAAAEEEGDAEAVAVPALGLSNKAVRGAPGAPTAADGPTEEALAAATLWPETRKLYGLGREVYALGAASDGAWLAAASVASGSDQATALLWRREGPDRWSRPHSLRGHTLTVCELRFAPGRPLLLSVSRDRAWRLWRLAEDGAECVAVSPTPGGHSRIIWACAWAPDADVFFTGSRDKCVVAWAAGGGGGRLGEPFSAAEAVTAMDAAPACWGQAAALLAVGLETGAILLVAWSAEDGFREVGRAAEAHDGRVNRLRFRPAPGRVGEEQERCWQLASAGDDHLVMVQSIRWPRDE